MLPVGRRTYGRAHGRRGFRREHHADAQRPVQSATEGCTIDSLSPLVAREHMTAKRRTRNGCYRPSRSPSSLFEREIGGRVLIYPLYSQVFWMTRTLGGHTASERPRCKGQRSLSATARTGLRFRRQC